MHAEPYVHGKDQLLPQAVLIGGPAAERIGARRFFAPEPGIIGFGAMGLGAAVFVFEF